MSDVQIHNHSIPKSIRILNELYNSIVVLRLGLAKLNIQSKDGYMLVWLKKLIRGLKYTNLADFSKFVFVDIGSGTGIPLVFVKKRYNFQNIFGIEIDGTLLGKLTLSKNSENIETINKDIRNVTFESNNYVFYLFNPFTYEILREFINNNIDIFLKSESLILYINDVYINELLNDFSNSVLCMRDKYYNISIIRFINKEQC
jgi:SAM-dependent methyltransferase